MTSPFFSAYMNTTFQILLPTNATNSICCWILDMLTNYPRHFVCQIWWKVAQYCTLKTECIWKLLHYSLHKIHLNILVLGKIYEGMQKCRSIWLDQGSLILLWMKGCCICINSILIMKYMLQSSSFYRNFTKKRSPKMFNNINSQPRVIFDGGRGEGWQDASYKLKYCWRSSDQWFSENIFSTNIGYISPG